MTIDHRRFGRLFGRVGGHGRDRARADQEGSPGARFRDSHSVQYNRTASLLYSVAVKRLLLFSICPLLWAQSGDLVEMELMTHPEIYSAIHEKGRTTVLIYNGGTEQRGPQAVLGGHTIMARRTAEAIARKLGNALVAPVLPFSLAGGHLKPEWPGSVHIDGDIFTRVNEQVVDSMMVNGFKDVILIGDHGGGQKEMEQIATRL